MDQETALKLLEKGGTFIFLNVPEGTEFGIDMKSWNTGEKFRGVKMIPPGLHYIFYSATSDTGDTAPRTGFFYNFRPSEVLVKKWDPRLEDISSDPVAEEEIVRLKDNIKSLDQFLGPYPYDIHDKWKSLIPNLTDEIVNKLTPVNGKISSALELQSMTDAERPRGAKKVPPEDVEGGESSGPKKSRTSKGEEDFLPELKAKAGTELRLTELPDKNYPDGSTPSQITMHSLDSSYALENMLSKYLNSQDILAELEFCYICFLVGHSLEAFEHWKKLFTLITSCQAAITKHRRLYDSFINTVDIQIEEIPEEFLADIVANKNFVYVKLKGLFREILSSEVDGYLKRKVDRLKQKLTDSHFWDFQNVDSEEEDEAPVIVYLDEDQ